VKQTPETSHPSPYERAGVAPLGGGHGFRSLLADLGDTFGLRPGAGRPLLGFGHYASVVDLGGPKALAISTDGIGSKAIVAQLVDRYDTVGIDCVAMNANDIICVGAEPITMVDYLAVEAANDRLLEEIGKGLAEGARRANLTIPGGEISQTGDIIKSERSGYGFDLAGTCAGLVDRAAIITGESIAPGDIIVGLFSSGIHSNGLSLARKVFFEEAEMPPDEYVAEFGRTVGEELLEPTTIYVKPVLQMLEERLDIKALAHITGEGFLNLARLGEGIGFVIDHLPDAPPVFQVLQRLGGIEDAEMFYVYNMGVGFCVIVAPESADRVCQIARTAGHDARRIGYCLDDAEKQVRIESRGLVGRGTSFTAG
jgi:phosphoribosylformylglycinamidine cyclo-ligase